LDDAQKEALSELIVKGPQASGFTSGVWTGPMIKNLAKKVFGVAYHPKYLPSLLKQMGFSVLRISVMVNKRFAHREQTFRSS
jgi:transposase